MALDVPAGTAALNFAGVTVQLGSAQASMTVTIPPEQLSRFPADKRDALIGVLAQDPRHRYQAYASRVYGLEFGGYEIKFRVDSQTLTVTDIIKKDS